MMNAAAAALAALLVLSACGSAAQPAASQVQSTEAAAQTQATAQSTEAAAQSQAAPQSAEAAVQTTAEAKTETEAAAGTGLQTEEAQDTEDTDAGPVPSAGTLVVYFSRMGNTDFPDDADAVSSASLVMDGGLLKGNAELLAEWIGEETGAPCYEICTTEKYPADYDDTIDIAQQQQRDDARPELTGQPDHLEDVDTIWFVIPNWWGDLPMPLFTFLEENDLSGKTVHVVITHGGSGFSSTLDSIRQLQPDAVIQKTLKIHARDVAGAEEEVKSWVRE